MSENRRYQRFIHKIPLKINHPSSDIVAETKNISGNGVYCLVNDPLDEMTKLEIVISLPTHKNNKEVIKNIKCHGVVVRRDPLKANGKKLYHIGIYFNEIKDKDRKALVAYLSSMPQGLLAD